MLRISIVHRLIAAYEEAEYQCERLVQAITYENDPLIAAVILYGSVARLDAGIRSDIDLLVLVNADSDVFEQKSLWFTHCIREIEDARDTTWHMLPILCDATGQDLDPDFRTCINDDGVLLFHRKDYHLPPAFHAVRPLAAWLHDVHRLTDALANAALILENAEPKP